MSAQDRIRDQQAISRLQAFLTAAILVFSTGCRCSKLHCRFWGVNEDASFASRLLANASRFDRDVVEISTVTAVMNAYFQVLNAQDQLQIARTQCCNCRKS